MTLSSQTTHSGAQADRDRGSSFAAELERDKAHRERARSAKPLRQLVPFILAYPGLLIAFVIFLTLSSTLVLILPATARLIVDCGFAIAPSAQLCTQFSASNQLAGYFGAGMIVAILLGIASALRYYFISRLGERVVADLRRTVYDHLLTLSPGFYAHTRTGEVLSRLTTDTTLIQTVIGTSMSVALRTIATTVGALILMVVVNWQLALMVLGCVPIIFVPIKMFGQRVRRLSRSGQDNLAAASARASEALRAVETVQAFTREDEERSHYGEAVEDSYKVSLHRVRVRALMTALVFSVVLTSLIAVLWFGAVQVQSGHISAGEMAQFVMYAFVAVGGVSLLAETYTEIMRAAGASERLMEILAAKSDITAPAEPTPLPTPARGSICFTNIDFFYPARADTKVLDNVSLEIAPGQTVALVGPSGGGKSTIFQLLLRFYDPQSGSITIDDINIRDLDPAALRQSIAVVQQNAPLFAGTAADNIRFGRTGASLDAIIAAAKAANADDFINALPQGYDTQLGEGAATLSGGQRQRIAIARAILRDAPILLLDEATSALDSESERAIQKAFETISVNRTTLVIAHRLATVLQADKIAVMDQGRIIDQGTHDELLAKGGLYTRLAELQFGQQIPGLNPSKPGI